MSITLPYAPLHDELGKPNNCEAARLLGVSTRTILRWRQSGIPLFTADHMAVQRGTVPHLLWPNSFTDQPEPQCDSAANRPIDFFPLPVRFRRQGQTVAGELDGYIDGPGDFYGKLTFARITAATSEQLIVPLSDLIDD